MNHKDIKCHYSTAELASIYVYRMYSTTVHYGIPIGYLNSRVCMFVNIEIIHRIYSLHVQGDGEATEREYHTCNFSLPHLN